MTVMDRVESSTEQKSHEYSTGTSAPLSAAGVESGLPTLDLRRSALRQDRLRRHTLQATSPGHTPPSLQPMWLDPRLRLIPETRWQVRHTWLRRI